MPKSQASRIRAIIVVQFIVVTMLVGCADRTAIQPFREEPATQSRDAAAHADPLATALDHFSQNRYGATIAACDGVIANHPDNAQAYMLRGVARLVADHVSGGIADIDEAFHLNPQYVETEHRTTADSAAHSPRDRAFARYQSIVRNLDSVSILRPRYADAFAVRGRMHERQNEPTRAIYCCTEAIRLNPQHAQAHLCRGNALRMTGEAAAAESDFRRAVELQPSLASIVAELRNGRAE